MQDQTPTNFWDSLSKRWQQLTRPSDDLRGDDRRKAATLASLLVLFFPLALLVIMITPITSLLSGKEFTPPNAGTLIAVLMIGVAYAISRSVHYRIGALLGILVPYIAVILPVLMGQTTVSAISLFSLSLGVILSSLLLTP